MNQRSLGVHPHWMFYLVIGLLIESCCLASVLFTWMMNRGISPATILELPKQPQEVGVNPPHSTNSPLPATPLPGFSKPTEMPVHTPTNLVPSPYSPPTATIPSQVLPVTPPGRIVFTCFDGQFDQICLMDADGNNRQQLTFENATSFYPSISIDGSVIAFSSNRDGNFEIYVMDTAGRNPIQLTNNIGNLYAPEISPKGNRIVFTRESGGVQDIWVMQLDGSNARPLFQGSGKDIDPTWSPDGQQVAFSSAVTGSLLLYVTNLENGKIYAVLREMAMMGGRSNFSPDGKWLAFYAGPNGDRNIYIVSPEGGALQQLTFEGDNLAPSFSPDSQWLAFTSFRDENNEIYVMEIGTRQAYRITYTPKSDWQPRWGP